MNCVQELLKTGIEYGDLVKVFRNLSADEKQMIKGTHSSFLDWVVDPCVNKLSSDDQRRLLNNIRSAIKLKLEIGVTALGNMKVKDILESLFHSKDFSSIEFARAVLLSYNTFVLNTDNGEEHVKIGSSSNDMCRFYNDNALENGKAIAVKCSSIADTKCVASSVCSTTAAETSSSIKDSTRDKQLRFLYKCQPDCIAALQPNVKFQQLLKPYDFWKSCCSHTYSTFIAWLLDMADAMYFQNDPIIFKAYMHSLQRAIAQEAYYYVVTKPRTIQELINLLSQSRANFVGVNYMKQVIIDCPDILKLDSAALATSSWHSQLVYAVIKPTPIVQCSSESQEVDSVKEKKIKPLLDVSLKDQLCVCGMLINEETQEKIQPILSNTISLDSVGATLQNLSKEKEFPLEVTKIFGCYFTFLTECFKQIKCNSTDSAIKLEEYEKHLYSLVATAIKVMPKIMEKTVTSLENVVSAFHSSNSLKSLIDIEFLRKSLLAFPQAFQIKDECVLPITDEAPAVTKCLASESSQLSSVAPSISEIAGIPHLQEVFDNNLNFTKFLKTFQVLPDKVISALIDNSTSFYMLLLSVADIYKASPEICKNQLRTLVVSEIEDLFARDGTDALSILNIQIKLCNGHLTLLHCPDIRDAVEKICGACRLVIKDAWVFLQAHKTTDEPASLPMPAEGHSLIKYNYSIGIERFEHDVDCIIHRSKSARIRLDEMVRYVNEIPGSFMAYIMEKHGTVFNFMVHLIPDRNLLYSILEEEVLNFIGSKTLFCEELMKSFFKYSPYFTCLDEFMVILGNKDIFVLVGSNSMGHTVTAVRRAGSDGLPCFYDSFEKNTFSSFMHAFPQESQGIPIGKLCHSVWNLKILSNLQRDFIFGAQGNFAFSYHEMHFKRYLLMHPSYFSIEGETVYFSPPVKTPVQSDALASKTLSSPKANCKNASGPVSSYKQKKSMKHNSGKLKRKKRQSLASEEDEICKLNSKKCSTDICSQTVNRASTSQEEKIGDKCSITDESLKVCITNLPDNLIQDVCVGRILASGDCFMKFNILLESLTSSLFNKEEREMLSYNPTVKNLFKCKVSNALSVAAQFELSGLLDDGFYNAIRLLVQKSSDPLSQEPAKCCPLVFKWVTRLTGVSKQKLSSYITRILDINRQTLSLDLLFTMVSQKFNRRKATPDTPDEVLHSQVVACLKSSPKFFVNVVQSTCCLVQYINEGERSQGLQTVTENVNDKDVNQFIMEYLKNKECCQGVTLDQLSSSVALHFEGCFENLSVDAAKIIVQGLVAESFEFGFTPLGKVALQQDSPYGYNDETLKDSSEDELRMDVSEDEGVALPDSTNRDSTLINENASSENILKDSSKSNGEEDVIRLSNAASKRIETPNADSTTISISSVSQCVTSDSPESPPSVLQLYEKSSCEENKVEYFAKTEEYVALPKTPACPSKLSLSKRKFQEHEINKQLQSETVVNRNIPEDRVSMLKKFASEFCSKRGYSCETHVFVDAAFENFRNKRFAKSILAFEAYVYDFVVTSNGQFYFGNCDYDVGVTWLFCKSPCISETFQAKTLAPFSDLLIQVPEVAYSYLLETKERKVQLSVLCEHIAAKFCDQLMLLHPNEVIPTCRYLILLSFIRDLKRFMFAKVEPVLYIRPHPPPSSSTTAFLNAEHRFSVPTTNKPKSQMAKNTVLALERMAIILRKHGPCTKTNLRDYWSQEANASLRKVFGCGVSFALTLRKFESYFPTTDDGLVCIDEAAFKIFLKENT